MATKEVTDLTRSRWVQQFIADLGWGDSERQTHTIPAEYVAIVGEPRQVWHEAGLREDPRAGLLIQINEVGIQDGELICAGAVYAIRFRVCTGWHGVRLTRNKGQRKAEAFKLGEWLHRRHFEDESARRAFRLKHPETAGYTWKRIRETGPPYFTRKTSVKNGFALERIAREAVNS